MDQQSGKAGGRCDDWGDDGRCGGGSAGGAEILRGNVARGMRNDRLRVPAGLESVPRRTGLRMRAVTAGRKAQRRELNDRAYGIGKIPENRRRASRREWGSGRNDLRQPPALHPPRTGRGGHVTANDFSAFTFSNVVKL